MLTLELCTVFAYSTYMSFSYNVLVPAEKVQEGIRSVASQILEDFPPDPNIPPEEKPLFVAFLKGALPFAKDLMFELERQSLVGKSEAYNPQLDVMVVSAYGDDEKPREPHIALDLDPDQTVRNRTVIIVEDLLDTGTTIDYVSKHLRARGAAAIKVAVLAEKVQERENGITADYRAFEFDPELWLVGMGMDHAAAGPDAMRSRTEILAVDRSSDIMNDT
jgi:hypoxanthine phosphoribosyltransferase